MATFIILYQATDLEGTGFYGGRAIDEELPINFYNFPKYNLGIVNEKGWSFEESRELSDGKHSIILGFNSGTKKVAGRIVILPPDLSRVLVDANSALSLDFDTTFKVEFKVSGTSISDISLSYWSFGSEITEPSDGSPNQIDITDIVSTTFPLLKDFMGIFMQMVMLMGFMNMMVSMVSSLGGMF